MSRTRRLLVPGLMTLVMLALLLALGIWQVERLAWKTAILDEIDRAERLPAVPMPENPAAFTKVLAVGTLRPDLSVLYGAIGRDTPRGTEMGSDLISVLERPGQPPLLVDRGWVSGLPTNTAPIPASIEGFIRPGERPGPFAATDSPATHRFYTLDPIAIAGALGLRGVADHVLVALGPPTQAEPEPAHALPRPPNNHLSYAITWFGLAIALLVIFIVYARKVPPA
jgi:surfeit locus 1 family protein